MHTGQCRLYPQYYAVRILGNPWQENDEVLKSVPRARHASLQAFLDATNLETSGLSVVGMSFDHIDAVHAVHPPHSSRNAAVVNDSVGTRTNGDSSDRDNDRNTAYADAKGAASEGPGTAHVPPV